MPIDYSKCKMYRLIADGSDDMYIGSTCQPLCKRIVEHRNNAKYSKRESNLYNWMRDIGIENVKIVLISEHPECQNFEQQRMFEREAVERLQPSLNMKQPYRSMEERQKYHREYNKINCDRLREYSLQYYSERREHQRQKCREYYANNREKMREYGRKYREAKRGKNANHIDNSIDHEGERERIP